MGRAFFYTLLALPVSILVSGGTLAHGPHSYDRLVDEPLPRFGIQSKNPYTTRQVSVRLPLSYKTNSEDRYAVLFVLDADRLAAVQETISVVDMLADRHKIPELIVVFLHNESDVARSRDYTPSQAADSFLEFFEHELIPWVDSRYRTTLTRLICGHSRSGLLVMHALLTKPNLFDAHFALSPALWHDDDLIVDVARELLQSRESMPGFLYANIGGQENENITNSFDRMKFILDRYAPNDLNWQFDYAAFETHGTTRPLGMYLGLRKFFIDWDKQWK